MSMPAKIVPVAKALEILAFVSAEKPTCLPKTFDPEIIKKIPQILESNDFQTTRNTEIIFKGYQEAIARGSKISQEQLDLFPENIGVLCESKVITITANAILSIWCQLNKASCAR